MHICVSEKHHVVINKRCLLVNFVSLVININILHNLHINKKVKMSARKLNVINNREKIFLSL